MNLTNVSKINGVEKERMLKLGNILRTRIVGGENSNPLEGLEVDATICVSAGPPTF
jgi:hypothetical protein